LSQPGQIGEWAVVLQGQESRVAGRVCAIRKTEQAIQQAQRRLERKASKKQTKTKPETREYAKYVGGHPKPAIEGHLKTGQRS
jgi:ElaB/YqjD/DUF883 family membrane-anchored ribosome-binding protein